MAAPTTTTSRTTIAGELEPIWPGFTTSRSRPSVSSTIPFLPNVGMGRPGLGVERDELIARRDEEEPRVVLAVGPVGEPAILFSRGAIAAFAFVEAVHPERLAGGRVDGDDVTPGAGGEVQHAADHQRRDFPVVVGRGAEVVGLPAPDDLELLDVLRVDLVQRRVLGVALIAAVVAPFALRGALLRVEVPGEGEQQSRRGDEASGLASHLVRVIVIWLSASSSVGNSWSPAGKPLALST